MDKATIEEIAAWVAEIETPTIAIGMRDGDRIELTANDSYPVVIEAANERLSVISERELPPEVQGVAEFAHLQQAVLGQARAAALPTVGETRIVNDRQWASFRVPLNLQRITPNELAAAVWAVWKAQELLAVELHTYKQLTELAARLDAERPPEVGIPEGILTELTPKVPSAPQAAGPPAAPSPAPSPPPPPAPIAGGVFCAECGRQARPGARFCNGCGAPLEA
jgi:hypothetical protein